TLREYRKVDLGARVVRASKAVIRSGCRTGAGAARRTAGHRALHAAMGEINGDGGEGRTSGAYGAAELNPGDGSVRAAEWGVSEKGGGVRRPAGVQSSRRWSQRHFGRVCERVAVWGVARDRVV